MVCCLRDGSACGDRASEISCGGSVIGRHGLCLGEFSSKQQGCAHTVALPPCGPTTSSSVYAVLVAGYHLHSIHHPRYLPNRNEELCEDRHRPVSCLDDWSLAWTPAVPDCRLNRNSFNHCRTPYGTTSSPGSHGTSHFMVQADDQPVVAPDDLVTLSSWITFTWMNKFIAYGNSKELEPEDLPPLSLTMQTSIVFHRFKDLSSSTLLRRILSANAIDLALDGLLTLFSVIFNYAGPFFLKRIL